ncbi:MAG: hypothetical protein ABIJ40_09015 [Bacteroidota bacterium]
MMNNVEENTKRIYNLFPNRRKDMLKYYDIIYRIMKDIIKIAIGFIILGILFILGIFVNNFLAASIGLFFVGVGANLIMFSQNAKSRSMIYMWVVILILIAVLLGLQYLIKDLSINVFNLD